MAEWWFGVASALWLGILTSISPCPLATNITAISFVGRRAESPTKVFFAGLLYTIGRALTYATLGVLLATSLLSAPRVSFVLQKYMNRVLGPVLILAGMFLLELLRLRLPSRGVGGGLQKRVETWGIWGALLLGILFALSFCPVSAALFFGSLLPLAIKNGSGFLFPALYGAGTAIPVLVFALLLALGMRSLRRIFNQLVVIEVWGRRLTGTVFVGVGVYFSLVYIYEVIP
jgi:cytochrome c-type biogenesis protein